MSHAALNGEQFADHVHPHQLAIPGMEHMAHPWAEHLSRGWMLQYHSTETSHQLQAVEPGWEHAPEAHLTWASKTPKTSANAGTPRYAPGEIEMVENEGVARHGKGLAGALLHSAHHFNFGQTTLPIHSPERTTAGNVFASRHRPDLRPDIWFNMRAREGRGQFETLAGERTNKYEPDWNLPENFHPYQQQKAAKEQALAQRMRAKNRKPRGQGSLF